MNALGKLTILIIALLASSEWCVSHAQSPMSFVSVIIESHPKDGGYAHKTVQADGTVAGAHLSGPPNAVRIFESKAQMTLQDMTRLKELIASLQDNPPKGGIDRPDQKVEGYLSVIIRFDSEETITVHTPLPQSKFEHPEVQAIWDLVSKYNAGAW